MPRQSYEKAMASARQPNGVGPIYQHLLAHEVAQDRRYRPLGRPRLLLEALQAGEPVTVPVWKVPAELRPPGCAATVVVSQDM